MKKIICLLCTIVVMMWGIFACTTEQADSVGTDVKEEKSGGGESSIKDGTVFKLTLDNQGAKTAGSAQIFLKYNIGYYLDKNGTKAITDETGAITIPVKTGFAFLGYNVKKDGSGQTIITSDGLLDLGAGYADFEADGTLYAQWEKITVVYTVSFNANGGSGSMPNQTFTYDVSQDLTSFALTAPQYKKFQNWNTKADGTGISYSDGQNVKNLTDKAETIILYAQWVEKDAHHIYYQNIKTASNTMNKQTFKESENVTLQDLSLTGYIFEGWYDASVDGTRITSWIAGTYTDNVTLWARWTAITYTVTFNSNGGSGSMQSQTFTYDEVQNLTACGFTAPTGNKFGIWNTKTDGTGTSYNDGQSVLNLTDKNETVILYAQWIEKDAHQIIYNNLKSAENNYNPSTFRESQNVTLNNISLVGWIFDGWFTEEIGGSQVTGWIAGTKTDNVEVWAHWTADTVNYTVKKYFQTVSGDGYEQNLSLYPNQTKTGTTETMTSAEAEDNVTGFDLQPIEQQTIAGDGNTAVYVYYNRKTITYTFDSNGASWSDGTTANKVISGLYGGEVDMSSVIIKGWSYTWNDTVPFVFGSVDKTFTAQCTEKWDIDTTGDIVYGNTVYLKTAMVTVLEQSTTITCDQNGGVFPSARGSVTLGKYAIGKYEVTQELYNAVMGSNPSNFTESQAALGDGETNALLRPVENVSWYEAVVFCNKLSLLMGKTRCYKLSDGTYPEDFGTIPTSNNTKWDNAVCDWDANGYRLPTECEWECAARGGVYSAGTPWTYTYSGSNTVGDVAWYSSNSSRHPWEVGLKDPNSLGLYDMNGNVWEWCWDYYNSAAAIDGITPVTGPTTSNSSNFHRRHRGGSWYDIASNCTVSYRNYSFPYSHSYQYGFRLACLQF